MKSSAYNRIKAALGAAGLSLAAFLAPGQGAALASPTTYTFQSSATTAPLSLFGSDPSVINAALAVLGPNPVITGSFVYDPDSPLTIPGTATQGSIYASAITPSFSNFTATIGGFTFSDPAGFTIIGNNKTFGPPNVDSIQLNADSQLASSALARNFTSFTLGIAQVVDVRLFWSPGVPTNPADFLTSEDLPAVLPGAPRLGRISLDFNDAAPGSTLVTRSGLLLEGVAVTPVPEPGTYAMLLAGLFMLVMVGRGGLRGRA